MSEKKKLSTLIKKDSPDTFQSLKLKSNKNIKCRPWKIKEEKEFLFAIEDHVNDDDIVEEEVIKLVGKCLQDVATLDKISETELLDLVSQLRKVSKGENIDFEFTCSNPKCRTPKLVNSINVSSDIQIKTFNPKPIAVGETTFSVKEIPYQTKTELEKKYKGRISEYNYYYLLNSISAITQNGEVFDSFSLEELDEFLDDQEGGTLSILFKEIKERMSEFNFEKIAVCPLCTHKTTVTFDDLLKFFVF